MSEVQRGNTVIEAKDLRPGEEILWQSATEPIGLLEGSCGKQIIKSWIIITVITLALVIACTAVIGHRCPEGQDHVHHGAWQGG